VTVTAVTDIFVCSWLSMTLQRNALTSSQAQVSSDSVLCDNCFMSVSTLHSYSTISRSISVALSTLLSHNKYIFFYSTFEAFKLHLKQLLQSDVSQRLSDNEFQPSDPNYKASPCGSGGVERPTLFPGRMA